MQNANLHMDGFGWIHPHFQLSFDKMCFMFSDGLMKIVWDKKNHHKKNVKDEKVLTTLLRVGTMGGVNGTVALFKRGVCIQYLSFFQRMMYFLSDADLCKQKCLHG